MFDAQLQTTERTGFILLRFELVKSCVMS